MTLPRLQRQSILAGWVLVAAIIAAIISVAVGTTLGTTLYGMPIALAFVLSGVLAIAAPIAIPMPLVAGISSTVAVIALAVAQSGTVNPVWPWAVVTMATHSFVLVVVALQASARIALSCWAAAVAGTAIVAAIFPRATDTPTINVIIATTVTGVAAASGIVWRQWRAIRAQLIRERSASAEEHEGRVIAEEKTRIARELHDVVAHSMSIINVQASSAAYRHPGVTGEVAREFDEIAESARTAISELRGVLGVLRDDGAAPDLTPQPGLGDIPTLIETTAKSGVDVTLASDDAVTPHSVSDAAGLALYRVVQEGISNAIRHAPAAGIRVSMALDGRSVVVSVVNGPSADKGTSGGGHGVVGMRERIGAAGGTLALGPTADGGFSVVARVPVRKGKR